MNWGIFALNFTGKFPFEVMLVLMKETDIFMFRYTLTFCENMNLNKVTSIEDAKKIHTHTLKMSTAPP